MHHDPWGPSESFRRRSIKECIKLSSSNGVEPRCSIERRECVEFLSGRSRLLFPALCRPSAAIADVIIHRDGRYDFAVGYGPLGGINGDLLYTPLKGLLQRYKADKRLK